MPKTGDQLFHIKILAQWFVLLIIEWKKKIPCFAEGYIPSPASERFQKELLCEHGQLKIETSTMATIPELVWFNIMKIYALFQMRFPGLELYNESTETCNVCLAEQAERLEKQKMEKEKIELEIVC
jgi:hypothetical protein